MICLGKAFFRSQPASATRHKEAPRPGAFASGKPLGVCILRTSITSYSPLRTHNLEHQLENSEDAILLPRKEFTSEYSAADSSFEWPAWTALKLSVLAIPRNAHGVRQPNQFPGLEFIDDLREEQKGTTKDVLPKHHHTGEQSLTDQMQFFGLARYPERMTQCSMYQWKFGPSKFASCYIDSVVPTLKDGLAVNKTYTSFGTLTKIQIWNVTTP
ncbi:uncharacterized protein EDB91DRAFT_1083752 [Suillus paluster]|uniref:uncharacterized protein n=1 Tax=Suillus paluster TaxID=48578 RepID=UPI001B87C8B1|nr:uncharacterized protein EDB91DRAFT_1083752 [Suillus paluster]KAG1735297.1 hypothetical protein EDB91DRAFT_1083752 [Suillus paluster]